MLDHGDRELVRELHEMDLPALSESERQQLREGVARGYAADLCRIANVIRRDPDGAPVADCIMEHLYDGDLRGACDVAREHVRDLETRRAGTSEAEGANAAPSRPGALSRALLAFPVAAAFLAGVQGLSTGIGLVLDSVVAIVLGAVVLGMIGGAFLFDGRFALAGVLGLLSTIPGGVAVVEMSSLEHGEIVSGISVADAHSHPTAKGFVFSDGVVRGDLKGKISFSSASSSAVGNRPDSVVPQGSGSSTPTTYQAAPLATRDWEPNRPVLAWVVCVGDDCGDEWSDPYRAGVRVTHGPIVDSYEAAVEKARTEHALTEIAGAPMLEWVPSVDDQLSEWKLQAWLSYGLAYALLLPGMIITAWLRSRKSRR